MNLVKFGGHGSRLLLFTTSSVQEKRDTILAWQASLSPENAFFSLHSVAR